MGKPPAEGAEGRRPAKENTEQTTASQTQRWGDALSGLSRVREAAKRDKRLKFTALLHHVTVPLLLDSFYALKREGEHNDSTEFSLVHRCLRYWAHLD